MFSPRIEKPPRLVTITVSGRIDARDAKSGLESRLELADEMEPGFRLPGDLSEVTSLSASALPCIGFSILSPFHYAHDVSILNVENADTALAALPE